MAKEVPPKIFQALQLYVGGATWSDAADATCCHISTLRKYREYPECIEFLKEEKRLRAQRKREVLTKAHEKLIDASPAVSEELISIALSKRTKDYAKVAASSEIFKIIREGVMDEEIRAQLTDMK